MPNENAEGYRTAFGDGVQVPLTPVSTHVAQPIMTFNAAYTDGRPLEAEISIRTRQASFRPGEPMVLDVVLKNNSDRVMTIGHLSPEWDYDWEMRDEAGNLVSKTSAAQRPDIITHIMSIHLRPGEERSDSVWIDRLFDLNSPGVYTIQARHLLSSSQAVVSAKCTVQVLR